MTLTPQDLGAIKQLVDDSITRQAQQVRQFIDASIDERIPRIIDERINARVPQIVQPMLDRLENRFNIKIDQLTLDVGRFSLETTDNFMILNGRLDDLEGGLAIISEMADNNREENHKQKHKQA